MCARDMWHELSSCEQCELEDVRTPNGVSVAQCIKPGIDHKGRVACQCTGVAHSASRAGHAILRTLGLIAAVFPSGAVLLRSPSVPAAPKDETCFEVFEPLFRSARSLVLESRSKIGEMYGHNVPAETSKAPLAIALNRDRGGHLRLPTGTQTAQRVFKRLETPKR